MGWMIQKPDDIHKCRLTRAAGSHDCHELALFNQQGNFIKRNCGGIAKAIKLAHVFYFNNRHVY